MKWANQTARISLNIKTVETDHGEAPDDVKYDDLIRQLSDYLSKMVNRSMAMHRLLTTQQRSISWTEFIRDLKRKSKILSLTNDPTL